MESYFFRTSSWSLPVSLPVPAKGEIVSLDGTLRLEFNPWGVRKGAGIRAVVTAEKEGEPALLDLELPPLLLLAPLKALKERLNKVVRKLGEWPQEKVRGKTILQVSATGAPLADFQTPQGRDLRERVRQLRGALGKEGKKNVSEVERLLGHFLRPEDPLALVQVARGVSMAEGGKPVFTNTVLTLARLGYDRGTLAQQGLSFCIHGDSPGGGDSFFRSVVPEIAETFEDFFEVGEIKEEDLPPLFPLPEPPFPPVVVAPGRIVPGEIEAVAKEGWSAGVDGGSKR
jgi:hypothetical protein